MNHLIEKTIKRIKNLSLKLAERLKAFLIKTFVADSQDPQIVRQKHLRLGAVLFVIFIALCFLIIEIDSKSQKGTSDGHSDDPNKSKVISNTSGIKDLAKGVSNEQAWVEIRGKEVDEIRSKQSEINTKQSELESKVNNEKISKEEVSKLIDELKTSIESVYNQKLSTTVDAIREEFERRVPEGLLESKIIKQKKKIKKIGEYIPANSYARAKLIAGVDAGVGISSEANPRQTLLRITGEVVSAGIGADYLKTDRLIGCLLSAKAIGDISSEKAYLDGVLLTCAVDKQTAVEVPVKAYVTSHAKSGIRGEIVSREGDMVLKSFLSGLASGFGSGIQQMSQPGFSVNSAGYSSNNPSARDIFKSGIGAGASNSGDTLSQYFIKRAEQYQPVISIDEGIEVYVVFQEGFSLKEEDDDDKKNN